MLTCDAARRSTPRAGAGVSVDSEDEDDWGHFSFEDGDAPPSSLENYRWN